MKSSLLDTAGEYDKFTADAMRLAMDISGNQTFNTVKPLLNLWAAFSASNEVSCMTLSLPLIIKIHFACRVA